MIACVDVQYDDFHHTAKAALLQASRWTDLAPNWQSVVEVQEVAPYEPGRFFLRELPCLLKVLATSSNVLEVIVVDGYVWLDRDQRPGLGAKLFESLGEICPVIGVAKSRFYDAPGTDVFRGNSRQPLIVSSVGIDESTAAESIKSMHGPFRVPTLLRIVNQLAQGIAGTGKA